MPIWKSMVPFGEPTDEYFDGINHYISEEYYRFEAVDNEKIINISTLHHTHTFSFFFKNKKRYKE